MKSASLPASLALNLGKDIAAMRTPVIGDPI
jgi:hypothetical protein